MKLYLLTRIDEKAAGYGEYRSCVVAAESPHAARQIHPYEYGDYKWTGTAWQSGRWEGETDYTWVSPGDLLVQQIGVASKGIRAGVILADFREE